MNTISVQAIKADTRRAITIDNLMHDFGHGSANAQALMQALSDALASELAKIENSKIKMLYEEWKTLYGQVADMSILQADSINKEMCFTWGGHSKDAMPGRLFVIHTYNSLLIKLLGAEIISAHGLTTTQQPAQAMSGILSDTALLDTLAQEIEHAGIFTQAGIKGFVEEAIFSWYLDVARIKTHASKLVPALRNILANLSLYRTDRLNHTRDVLRDLYQGLVPGKLRQSLGEFYTPDWLVDFTVDKVKSGSWLNKRFLDPTCGSGAFLLTVLRRINEEAIVKGWSKKKIIEHMCKSVWGFDLNPLAVQTARVNFLMEIAALLKAAPGLTIELPILLADAIYSPAQNPVKGEDVVKYQIGSQVARLDITLPAALVSNRIRLDQIFAHMGEDVENNREYMVSEKRLLAAGLLDKAEAVAWRTPLKCTYDQILALHRLQWNGIWFRIVRNFFWSATAGHFDCIIGNPPWVRWSKLPQSYRDRAKPTCEKYDIFSKTKRHGGNELDISAMITYTTADKWLKSGGRLAFVITGAIFKNPSSAGFRQFCLNPHNPKSMFLTPVSVDDMKALKPFNDAANHTTVAVFDKTNTPGKYPVPYNLWSRIQSCNKSIPAALPLADVLKRTTITTMEAAPVDVAGSPWAVLLKGRHGILQPLSGKCSWAAGRKGITPDLNGVYYVAVSGNNANLVQIKSRPEAGKKDIGIVKTAWIEPDLLYPLLKGAGDFEACYLHLDNPARRGKDLFALVPNTGIDVADYRASEAALNCPSLANTKAWFLAYKKLLNARSTYCRQMKGAPFYAVYNVGSYTFQPYKVVWPEMASHFYAAVASNNHVPIVGSRPYVPDHKVYFQSFNSKEPAYFLCGLLNSPMVCEWIESHNVSIQIGNIFKHLQLPEFNIKSKRHRDLASLVEQSHKEHNADNRRILVDNIRREANDIVAKWLKNNS